MHLNCTELKNSHACTYKKLKVVPMCVGIKCKALKKGNCLIKKKEKDFFYSCEAVTNFNISASFSCELYDLNVSRNINNKTKLSLIVVMSHVYEYFWLEYLAR